jgi:alpha-galactosidase
MGRLSEFLDIPRDRLDAKVGGVNHFNWMVELWDRETGEDLFPRFRARVAEIGPPDNFELCCALWERFGVFPTTGDSHVGEHLSYGYEFFTRGYDYDRFLEQHRRVEARLSPYVDGRKPIADWVQPQSDADELSPGRTLAIQVMEHLYWRKKGRLLSVIVPNRGAIDNLADDSIVETAGLFEDGDVRGEPIGALPAGVTSMVRREQDIQELVVGAWAESSRDLALQALLLDPNVDSVRRAEMLLDRMLILQAEHLPPLE